MMLSHDLDKSPGQYRRGEIFVHDDERNVIVYEGPDYKLVPELMGELVASGAEQCPVFVRAAMAHLNLVMIHPFRDGNGRMVRALQTLVLAREQILAPEFSSIEEWLGRNTTGARRTQLGQVQPRCASHAGPDSPAPRPRRRKAVVRDRRGTPARSPSRAGQLGLV
jgi:Fic family protein